jgi:bidirectional [NiFe] hydrogenase diaphorase subunit
VGTKVAMISADYPETERRPALDAEVGCLGAGILVSLFPWIGNYPTDWLSQMISEPMNPHSDDPRQASAAASVNDLANDPRTRQLDEVIAQRGFAQNALIEILHHAQLLFGWLSVGLLRHVAQRLQLPPSRVFGVATFYHLFHLQPKGRHECLICLGTACYIQGGPRLLAQAEEVTKIHPGETTPNGQVSLFTARCIGACGHAPLTVSDHVLCSQETVESISRRLNQWMNHAS